MEEPYQHILYYSPSHIEQLFFDRIDDKTDVTRQKESWGSLKAGLSAFLPGSLGGVKGSRKKVMKSVNQSEEYIQTKRVVNHLLKDDSIPRLIDIDQDNLSSLYRFSCECQFLPKNGENAEDAQLIEIVGKEGDIEFQGITSSENWSSLSDTLMAMENELPYPLEGVVQVRDIQDQMLVEGPDGEYSLEQATCLVNFIFVCQSDRDEFQKWMNRKSLVSEYHRRGYDN